MKDTAKRIAFYLCVIFGGIAADQVTKYLAATYLTRVPTVPLIEGVLHLTYVENEGAAFGILKDKPWIFLVSSTVLIAVLLGLLLSKKLPNRLYEWGVLLVISGGIGNMIDRLSLRYVVDFIDFRLINFAVFNGADSFVCVGAGILALALILDIVKEAKEKK